MKIYILAVLALLVSHSVIAEEKDFYLGAGIGAIVVDGDALTGGGTGISLYGGYKLNRTFSLETSYHYFSDVKDDPVTISPRMFSLSGLAFYPLSDQLSIFARLGASRWDADIEFSGIDFRSKGGTDLTTGFGFEFKSSDNISWRQEYQYFQFDGDKVHTLFLSVNYQF